MSTPELTRNTENHNEQPKRPELTPRGRNVLIGLGAAAIVAGGIGLNHLANSYREGNVTDAPKDSSITELFIQDGAKLRSDADVGNKDFSNELDRVDLGDAEHIVLPTENGVHITSDENGTWYGVEADDLTSVLDVNVEDDEDGIIWVNDDRAEATPSSNIDLE